MFVGQAILVGTAIQQNTKFMLWLRPTYNLLYLTISR